MKKILPFLCSILLMIFCMVSCAPTPNTDSTSTSHTVDSDETVSEDVRPTGRSDGKSESTFVFYDNTLYVRDYSRFTADTEKDACFEVYSTKHSMNYLGEITHVDDDVPSKNFSAHEAQIGDKLYKDEAGNLFLVRNDGHLIALIPES